MINLLSNAVKFTPEGGRITLQVSHHQRSISTVEHPDLQGITRVRIHRTAVEEALHLKAGEGDRLMQTYLSIAVVDTGIGIDAADLGKLFQPFVQIDSALNRQYNGTGLGLALVKRLVELHGGQVSVTSQVGQGSRFSIDLPCAFSVLPRLDTPVEVVTSTLMNIDFVSPASGSLILLAEDNEANVSTISSYLKAKGYRIMVAPNGEVAIALTQQERPDLILMDVQMPGMDGLEAMQRLRQDPDFVDIPIIALTALAMVGDRERCLAAGATEYLTKPVKLKRLAATIQQLLNTL